MSLIIASNEISDNSIKVGQHQAPYSWSNHLNQPLKIPPNSEIAVQSLKINKDGTISVNPSHKFYLYYGVKLEDGTISYDQTTSIPHFVDLGLEEATELTVDELAEKITTALNIGVPTPETFNLLKCNVKRNASGTDFEGFDFVFKTRESGSALNNRPTYWYNRFSSKIPDAGLTFNSASNTLTPIAKYKDRKGKALFNMAIGETYPIATNGGEFTVDLQNVANTSWGVGLTRAQTGLSGTPRIYNKRDSDLAYGHFGDFMVYAIQDTVGGAGQNYKIRVYHSAYDSADTTTQKRPLAMREVDYTTGNGDLDSIYNWSTNGANTNYTKIKFIVNNENIKVELINAEGSDVLVAHTGDKGKRFNPVRDTCRNLYPTAFCMNNSSNDSYLTIDKFSGRDLTNFVYNNVSNDWWSFVVKTNQEYLARRVETRECMDMNNGTNHTYKGINASGVPTDYTFVMVLREDTNLYTDTQRASADTLFGFRNVVVLDTPDISGDNLEIQTYTSAEAPVLKSTSSIFVRLNNIPVKSYNAGQSRRSQIVYCAPRFATGTDKSVGALFYESPEKTYISMDNPSELNLNTLDIDIVNENETLATDLLGKTVCTLHVRPKK